VLFDSGERRPDGDENDEEDNGEGSGLEVNEHGKFSEKDSSISSARLFVIRGGARSQ